MPYNILKNKKLSIGFDPKLFTKKTLNIFFGKTNKNVRFKIIEKNLIDEIWKRKIKNKKIKFYTLPRNSGNTHSFKINKLVSFLKKGVQTFNLLVLVKIMRGC